MEGDGGQECDRCNNKSQKVTGPYKAKKGEYKWNCGKMDIPPIRMIPSFHSRLIK